MWAIAHGAYKLYLQLIVLSQLEDFHPYVWFQHVSAPPHWFRAARDHLEEVFPKRRIGREFHSHQVLRSSHPSTSICGVI
ncbi:hypothetical protein NPIL_613631 [Nephila pilipes]|uniref:Uncharacterized protein n=1 Tax=Nephila pilipes TaxID=299642 RepID=A0A8X6UMR4_NEPPI|nr:hypothetical protein NPIL_613631 [Nephila pilipes]